MSGSESNRQPVTPSVLRATRRCEMPRQILDADEQQRLAVDERGTGLKTELARYGRCAVVMIGLAG